MKPEHKFKVGDKVVVSGRVDWFGTVTKVTPTGMFYVDNGQTRYGADGMSRARNVWDCVCVHKLDSDAGRRCLAQAADLGYKRVRQAVVEALQRARHQMPTPMMEGAIKALSDLVARMDKEHSA